MRLKPIMPITLKFPERLAELIPKHEVTLLTGLPGTGKSFSLLKFLNAHDIHPILFNLDHDATLSSFKLNGEIIKESVLVNFLKDKYTDLKDEVIVLDTYQKVKEIISIDDTTKEEAFTKVIVDIARSRKLTIIVIGHPADFVGSSSIFKDNPSLVRNCYEHIHLDKVIDKRKKPLIPNYTLYVNKARGLGGAFTIEDWMR